MPVFVQENPWNAGDPHHFLSDQLLCVFRATSRHTGRGRGGLRTPAGAPAAAPDAAALPPAEFVLLLFSRSSAVQRPGARRCVTNTARSVRTSRASVKVEIHLGFRQLLLTRPIKQQFIWGVNLACSCGGGLALACEVVQPPAIKISCKIPSTTFML